MVALFKNKNKPDEEVKTQTSNDLAECPTCAAEVAADEVVCPECSEEFDEGFEEYEDEILEGEFRDE